MKQHITLEQFDKLSTKQKNRLLKWALNKEYVVRLPNGIDDLLGRPYYVPLLSIGPMIEFLDKEQIELFKSGSGWTIDDNAYHAELCDALWDAVKEVLNK